MKKSTLLLILLGMTIGIPVIQVAPAATVRVANGTKKNWTAPPETDCESVCSQYRSFSWAIAKAEGFFIKGSIPNRNHNPGDIKTVHGYRFPGQTGIDKHGHVIFRNDNKGWAALQNQVRKMCGESGHYSPQMSIQQVGKRYAKDWKHWSANVARNMNCDPRMTLAELFDIPPILHVPSNSKALEGIL